MALQDHFRPPLSTYRHWHAFHNACLPVDLDGTYDRTCREQRILMAG